MAFTIRELESLSGIKAHTIRIWEQRYNFLKPSRTKTNIRVYSNDELKTLLTVSLLNKSGYKISTIDKMKPAQMAEAVLQLSHKAGYNERVVNEMIGYMIDMENQAFEDLLNNYIKEHGIEETITVLIFYFLERIGILWQADRIFPVQEHIVSNIIRQKIVYAIEQLPFGKTSPCFLLFLPEDEHHEIGLLYVYYLLRKRNSMVMYLGANVPLKDVQYVLQSKRPAYLYLHLTSFPRQHEFKKFMLALSSSAKDAKVLISGTAVQTVKEKFPENLVFLRSFSEVTDHIDSIVFNKK